MFDAIIEVLKIHGPIGAVFLAVGYIGREHIKRDHRRFSEIEKAHKHDLERVFDRIERVADQMQENQNVLLQALTRTPRGD